MAQSDTKSPGRGRTAQKKKPGGLPFTKRNYYIFLAGLAVIVLGYLALSQGSITLAPILLVVGYCVILPVAILYRGKDETPGTASKPEG
ncbi:MAG: hypothetical protein AB1792_07430 [Candidatus Zixiibacteriota bacterium]